MTIKSNLQVVPEQGMGVHPDHRASLGARHSFAASPNPRNDSCVKCGRNRADSIHAYVDLAHRAAVVAHLAFASNAAQRGDLKEAAREARIATRLAEEEN